MQKIVDSYVERHIKRYHSKIQRICDPLKRFLGFNYFTYHSIGSDGTWCPIVSRIDWADYYTQNELYLQDPFILNARFYQTSTCLWQHCMKNEYQKEVLEYAAENFDMDHGFIMVEKNENSCEFFGFTAPKNHPQVYSTYLNHLPVLKQFCIYFKEEMSSIIKVASQDPIPISRLKGTNFEHPLACPYRNFAEQNNLFLNFIQTQPRIQLSKREKECLSYYIDDLLMAEVAVKMGLSIRTVEFYLGNLKNKLNCANKTELLKKGRELRSRGLL